MELSSMEKMWASFYGMGFMASAALIITFARAKTKGILRGILSAVAYVILLVSALYMLLSMI